MARIWLIHWSAAEATSVIELLRAAGHHVTHEEKINPGFNKRLRGAQPEAVVIDLTRLPSHGRNIGIYLRGQKTTRGLPLVFVGGLNKKVNATRALMPDATYTTYPKLKQAIRSALTKPVPSPIVPQQMEERYAARSAPEKLGVRPGSTLAVLDPPQGYSRTFGELPDGATLHEDPFEVCAVTVWFAHEPEAFIAALPRMRRLAAETKLWVAWRKKSAAPDSRLSENFIRESAIQAGLVDYKVCAIDATWSGLAFAPERTPTKMRAPS